MWCGRWSSAAGPWCGWATLPGYGNNWDQRVVSKTDSKGERPFEYYKGAAEYIRDHAPPETVVFNSDWDDFPYLFFFNSDCYYILGLDQLYMIHYDRELFDLWKDIRDGIVADPSGCTSRETPISWLGE